MFYYFEKYSVRDGESEYDCLGVNASEQPLTQADYLRELARFAWESSRERPWSQARMRAYLKQNGHPLPVYGGQRLYYGMVRQPIPRSHYKILHQYL